MWDLMRHNNLEMWDLLRHNINNVLEMWDLLRHLLYAMWDGEVPGHFLFTYVIDYTYSFPIEFVN